MLYNISLQQVFLLTQFNNTNIFCLKCYNLIYKVRIGILILKTLSFIAPFVYSLKGVF